MTDEIHPDGLPVPRRYLAMLAIAIGIAMAVLDGTVVNVALPSIARELGASPSAAVWVINAYQLVIVALLLPLASLGERIGYRPIYQVGVAVFTLGSLGCALSHSLPLLIAARVAAGGRRRGDHEHERRAGPPHLSRCPPRPRHRAERSRGRDRRGGRAVARRRDPRGRDLALALRGQRAVRPLNLWLARHLPRSETAHRPFDWTSALLSAAMFGLFFVGTDALTRGAAALPAAVRGSLVAVGGRRAPGAARRAGDRRR